MQHLNDSFLQELIQPLPELFELCRVWIVQIRKGLRSKARDFTISDTRLGGKSVPDTEIREAYQPNNVAREGLIHRLPFIAEEFVRAGKPHLFAGPRVKHRHIPLEFPGANAQKGNP